MPLTQQDENWGRLSEGWPEIKGEIARPTFVFLNMSKLIPYGSCVLVDRKTLRIENDELLKLVENNFRIVLQAVEEYQDLDPMLDQIVRYGDGVTALARIDSLHAGGYHGTQCLGGVRFFSKEKIRLATPEEIEVAKKSRYWAL